MNSLTTFSSWVGRDGIIRKYWSGNGNGYDVGCQCAFDGTCVRTTNLDYICNCDSRNKNVIDNGILSDKKSLPVMSLRYGGSVTEVSKIQYVLGPFICSGKANSYPSEREEMRQNKLQDDMLALTDRVNGIERKPIIAFRVIQVATEESDNWKLMHFLDIRPG